MDNHTFCRLLLAQVMPWVNKVTTPAQRKACWAHRYDYGHGDHCEWHGPDKYYWHGTACCKWGARYEGWMAWLRDKQPATWAEMEKEGVEHG